MAASFVAAARVQVCKRCSCATLGVASLLMVQWLFCRRAGLTLLHMVVRLSVADGVGVLACCALMLFLQGSLDGCSSVSNFILFAVLKA